MRNDQGIICRIRSSLLLHEHNAVPNALATSFSLLSLFQSLAGFVEETLTSLQAPSLASRYQLNWCTFRQQPGPRHEARAERSWVEGPHPRRTLAGCAANLSGVGHRTKLSSRGYHLLSRLISAKRERLRGESHAQSTRRPFPHETLSTPLRCLTPVSCKVRLPFSSSLPLSRMAG